MLQDRSVVILPPLDSKGGGGVGLPALVPGDHLDLASIPVLALRNVQVPHSIIDEFVTASLKPKIFVLNIQLTKFFVEVIEKLTLMTVCPLISHITLGFG